MGNLFKVLGILKVLWSKGRETISLGELLKSITTQNVLIGGISSGTIVCGFLQLVRYLMPGTPLDDNQTFLTVASTLVPFITPVLSRMVSWFRHPAKATGVVDSQGSVLIDPNVLDRFLQEQEDEQYHADSAKRLMAWIRERKPLVDAIAKAKKNKVN